MYVRKKLLLTCFIAASLSGYCVASVSGRSSQLLEESTCRVFFMWEVKSSKEVLPASNRSKGEAIKRCSRVACRGIERLCVLLLGMSLYAATGNYLTLRKMSLSPAPRQLPRPLYVAMHLLVNRIYSQDCPHGEVLITPSRYIHSARQNG